MATAKKAKAVTGQARDPLYPGERLRLSFPDAGYLKLAQDTIEGLRVRLRFQRITRTEAARVIADLLGPARGPQYLATFCTHEGIALNLSDIRCNFSPPRVPHKAAAVRGACGILASLVDNALAGACPYEARIQELDELERARLRAALELLAEECWKAAGGRPVQWPPLP